MQALELEFDPGDPQKGGTTEPSSGLFSDLHTCTTSSACHHSHVHYTHTWIINKIQNSRQIPRCILEYCKQVFNITYAEKNIFSFIIK